MNSRDRRVLAELDARKRRLAFSGDALCFPPQLAFVRDPSRFKAACTTRRAGKTVADTVALIEPALQFPGTVNLYITITRGMARDLVWRQLIEFREKYALGGSVNGTGST